MHLGEQCAIYGDPCYPFEELPVTWDRIKRTGNFTIDITSIPENEIPRAVTEADVKDSSKTNSNNQLEI
jgi:hypothetical protein